MSDDGPTSIMMNIIRVALFAIVCGVVFTILSFLSSYSIPDTQLRELIMEQRIMDAITNSHNNIQSISDINPEFLATAITNSVDLQKNDNFAIRLRFFDLATKKEIVLDPKSSEQTVKYDADVFTKDPTTSKFLLFYPLTGKVVHSNYESVVTKRLWTEPSTKRTIIIQFEYVAIKN